MTRTHHNGFTLIELLVVITMMGVIMAGGIMLFSGVFKSSAIGTGGRQVSTSLHQARQLAITQRTYVRIAISNGYSSAYSVLTNGVLVGRCEFLPQGCVFTNTNLGGTGYPVVSTYIEFLPTGAVRKNSGGADSSGNAKFVISDGKKGDNYLSVVINGLLGRISLEQP